MTGTPRRKLRRLAQIARRWADELAADPAAADERAALAGRVEAERVRYWLSRVQALPYVADPPGPVDLVETDWRRVLVDGGDCEERAMMLVAYCAADGIGGKLAWLTQEGAPLDHVSALVWLGGDVLAWADATVTGARLGEHPVAAARRTGYRPHQRGIA